MFELMEKNQKKDIEIIENDILKNATNKINQYHTITKRAILGISMILADIAEYPATYFENTNFQGIADYSEKMFGYKKSYTYKLIKISKFISIKDIKGENVIPVKSLINNEINTDYIFDVVKDEDGFEYSPSQMLELIPLTEEQLKNNIKVLDSSLTCKELRSIVKDIVNPPIEVKGESTEQEEDKQEDNKEEEEIPLTDKDRILQMLEICSGMENEDIKSKIINIFQKSLKALEK